MGCGCECLAKVFLVLINILTGIFGLILLAVGIFAQFATELIEQAMKGSATKLKNPGIMADDPLAMYNDVKPIVDGIAIPLIVLGAFFFIISMFGCYGACCNSQVCLIIYAITVTIVFVGLLAGVIYLIASANQVNAKAKAKSEVKKEIVENFVGLNSTNGVTLMTNVIQIYLSCCGVDNSEDFEKCKRWERNVNYNWELGKVKGYLQIPITCCKMKGKFPNVELQDQNCPLTPTTLNSNQDTGCFAKIDEYMAQYRPYLYAALVLPLVFLAILVALAWFLWHQARDSNAVSAAKMI